MASFIRLFRQSVVVLLSNMFLILTQFKQNGTNQVVFDQIGIGETKFWEPTFTVHSSASGTAFTSRVLIANSATGFSAEYPFDILKRWLPLKQYWSLVSLVLVALSGFVAKPDLLPFAANLLTNLFKPPGKN